MIQRYSNDDEVYYRERKNKDKTRKSGKKEIVQIRVIARAAKCLYKTAEASREIRVNHTES